MVQTQPYYTYQQYPCAPQPPQKQKWYRSNLGIISLLVFFFPVGLFLMWKYARWPKAAKWIVTGFFVLLLVIDAANGNASSNTSGIASEQTSLPTQAAQSHAGILAPTATPTPVPPTPTPIPQQIVQPTSPPVPSCGGTVVDGICYSTDPTGGSRVYNPAADFCGYFSCVTTFWTATSGYVVECANGKYSHSSGVSGACSRDGGVLATVYSH